jgi:lipopolysaccharide export system protein LptA
MCRRVRLLMGLWLLFEPGALLALSADKDQPIQVEADTVEIDDRRGMSVYRGNVRLTQGSILLRADTLTVHHPQRKLEKAIAEGGPAHYQQDLDDNQGQVKAQAQRMEYSAGEQVIVLSGRAQLWQNGNQFNGNHIRYDMQTDVVRAQRDEAGKERVQVTIQRANEAGR